MLLFLSASIFFHFPHSLPPRGEDAPPCTPGSCGSILQQGPTISSSTYGHSSLQGWVQTSAICCRWICSLVMTRPTLCSHRMCCSPLVMCSQEFIPVPESVLFCVISGQLHWPFLPSSPSPAGLSSLSLCGAAPLCLAHAGDTQTQSDRAPAARAQAVAVPVQELWR